MMIYRKAQYNKYGSIDCEVKHPEFGWIPFTASPDDVEELGRNLFANIKGSSTAAAYVPDLVADKRELERDLRAALALKLDALAASAGFRGEQDALAFAGFDNRFTVKAQTIGSYVADCRAALDDYLLGDVTQMSVDEFLLSLPSEPVIT